MQMILSPMFDTELEFGNLIYSEGLEYRLSIPFLQCLESRALDSELWHICMHIMGYTQAEDDFVSV